MLKKKGRSLYLSASWAIDLLDDLHSCGIELEFKVPGNYPEERTIMDVLSASTLGEEKLERLNLCRLSLGLITISNVRLFDGKGILGSVL